MEIRWLAAISAALLLAAELGVPSELAAAVIALAVALANLEDG